MKSVIVTGGTMRLGKAIAERLRTDGWRVIATSHRADSDADLIADLSQPDGADALYSEARRLLGGCDPDALVNNAAIYFGEASATELVGYSSPKRLIELMAARSSGVGAVVNILDAGDKGSTAYQTAKRNLREFTQLAAKRYLGKLRVNAISPRAILGLAPTATHEKAAPCAFARPTPTIIADSVSFLLANPCLTATELTL